MRQIHIWQEDAGQSYAVSQDGVLVEYQLEYAQPGSVDTVCIGRVERVINGMDAAFVNIGEERNAFLPLHEDSAGFQGGKLQAGQNVIVQVRREAHGQKGAFVSRDINLSGEYMIYLPMDDQVSVSGKIKSKALRESLAKLGRSLIGDNGGCIMRTACAAVEPDVIQAEATLLLERWAMINRMAPTAHVPSVLYRSGVAEAIRRDYEPRGIDRVIAYSAEAARAFQCPVVVGDDAFRAPLIKQRDEALGRYVWLKSGANLVIDECEAMTVIDVNSAKFTGKRDIESTVLKTNLQACQEIVHQLRLRRIGGIVIIDFIDMASQNDQKTVWNELEKRLADDRQKTVIHDYTKLGLMEMTRKRAGISLKEMMKQHSKEKKQ